MIILSTTLFGVFIPTWLVILFWVIVGFCALGTIIALTLMVISAKMARKQFKEFDKDWRNF